MLLKPCDIQIQTHQNSLGEKPRVTQQFCVIKTTKILLGEKTQVFSFRVIQDINKERR